MCSCRKLGLKTPTITHCIVIEPLYDSCSIYLILPILVLLYLIMLLFNWNAVQTYAYVGMKINLYVCITII